MLHNDELILSDLTLPALIRGVANLAAHEADDKRFNPQFVAVTVRDPQFVAVTVRDLILDQHHRNLKAGWWTNLETGEKRVRNMGELLMLMVSEIGEIPLLEYRRGTLMDDKLPERLMFEVELADFLIRLWDTAGAYYSIEFPAAFAVACDSRYPDVGNSYNATNEILLAIIGHLSRAMEAHRKGRPADEVAYPLAWTMLLTFRMGKSCGLDVPGACIDKIAFNATREDHKIEARRAPGGKAY